jgi:hypothetical protein
MNLARPALAALVVAVPTLLVIFQVHTDGAGGVLLVSAKRRGRALSHDARLSSLALCFSAFARLFMLAHAKEV